MVGKLFLFSFSFLLCLRYVDLSGWWNGGGWVCFDLVVVWVVNGMVVGVVLSIWWWMLGFAEM